LLKEKFKLTTENMPKKSNTAWYIGAVVIIIVIIAVGVLAYQFTQPSPTPTPSPSTTPSPSASPSPSPTGTAKSITIYADEISTSQYGFGESATAITSPGPTLTFNVGDVVTLTFQNAGAFPHNVAFVTQKTDGNTNLAFPNAQVASASNPIAPGGSASVTFTVTTAGTFYYICQVDAHVSLGMWGTVTVNP
jgi:plastocyanin